ncbi:CHAT domain-containing protein [Streptomyces sp. NBC_01571]|uniref:CHAT domain-containing protein n=1 Tax=Streptomyces sp. NBC_01571 TaxID=2975883 RepID=UPI00224E3505|nr:CHAT domain-containing protein [Streptomyces sp. NBC_01571]MCX4579086.1 CHAT domain-containing protein [Streptomyces sp. NBC_01571]
MATPYDLFGTPGYEQLLAVLGGAEEALARYERAGRLSDLERALVLFDALLARAENIDLRSAAMNGVGMVLWARYERFGEPADLDGAITLFREALAPYGAEVTVTTPSYWTNLSGALRLRWLRTHDVRDLGASVDAVRTALVSTPPSGPLRSNRLNSLGDALLNLFQLHGDSSALAEAVSRFREAVACTEPGTDEGVWARSSLAEALRHHHRWSPDGAPEALDEAAGLAREVLAGVSRRHRLYPRFLSNLALVLTDRHTARADPADLREAARAARRAVAATPAGHPNLVQRNAVLATVRRLELVGVGGRATGLDVTDPGAPGPGAAARPDAAGVPAVAGARRRPARREQRALRAWIRATGQAYAATPEGHALRGLALLHHGSALATKAVTEDDARARDAAIALYRRAARDPAMDVSVRVGCARLWALSVLDGGGSPAHGRAAAMEPYRLAVELLPRTASYRVGRMDRARQLGDFAGLAGDAAACALDLADARPPDAEGAGAEPGRAEPAGAEAVDADAAGAELALRLLEQGRGVLLGQALDARTETSELLSRVPDELLAEWRWLVPQLDRPEAAVFTSSEPGGTDGPAAEDPLTGEDRHALAERWERLVETIRRVPGCESFLRLPRTHEMLAGIADAGPVVVVNVSPLRCDALVLHQGHVRPVRLEGLRHAEAERRADAFLAAIRATGDHALPLSAQRDAQTEVRETLEWLWTVLARPVLDALAGWGWPGEDPAGEPGRLWWVPTGPLTALPLHAAGRHENGGESLLDRAVCSYAPTVNSLVHARRREAERPDPVRPEPTAPLIVAVAEAPDAGSPPLEGVREEATRLARRPGARLLLAEDAVRQSVLDALPHHAWAHFACHAVGALSGAAAGHVVLHDHATAPLTLSDIARLRLPEAELAYLSACETTSGRREFADEALHITGAFHMAGFTHVVGTLWAVADDTSLEVTDRFYAVFDPSHPFPGHTAHALHEAVREIRENVEGVRENPSLWAPYIHVGP